MQDLFEVSGKHVLITGASSGLGEHFARMLSARGASVSITARRVDRLESVQQEIQAQGKKCYAVAMDVASRESVSAGIDQIEKKCGSIDVLINNAGIASGAPALETSVAEWHRVINTNLNGAWYVLQETGQRMINAQQGGSIINLASILSSRVSKGSAAYASSKAAVDHLTRVLALEWAQYEIRVNAIAPGYIHSEMTEQFLNTENGKAVIQSVPMRRAGNPDDLDGVILLLASDASRFMTGATIPVDGGHLQSSL